ncbi:MAG: hypothetical protein JJU00_11785 [Opitutales bacterium]|nr:hypothetical protein [Opitutales bacterium]
MAPVADGFLVIANHAGSESNKRFPDTIDFTEGRLPELFLWNPSRNETRHVATLPSKGKGKEEGLLVLEEGRQFMKSAFIYDSLPLAGLLRYQLNL